MGCGASQPEQYRNGAPPVAVAQRPMEVVTVPAGVVGGQQLMLQMPSGSTRQVVVPAGLKAGDKFRVAAPGSGPPVPMGKPVPPMGEPSPQPPVVGRPPVDPEVARLQAELELLRERNRHAEEEAARARAADNARIQAMEDQRRREQAEADRRVQAVHDAEAAAAAQRRRTTNRGVGVGATIGFFAMGPLGAAIGGYYGNKWAKERIEEDR